MTRNAALTFAIEFAGLTPMEVEALTEQIERSLSPASTITAQYAVTMDNLRHSLPAFDVGRMQVFAIAYLEGHAFYAGNQIPTA